MGAAFRCVPILFKRSARADASPGERSTQSREQQRPRVRHVSTLLPCLLSALLFLGCSATPGAPHLFGIGDPVRGAAVRAPNTLGDTSRWAGRPVEAAEAAAELEFLANEFATNPRYAAEANPAVPQQLDVGRREMREFLGISPAAAPELVIAALRRASGALRTGSRAGAEAALSGPAFTYGPAATLGRLASMPRLPRVSEAAGGVAAEIDRLSRRR